MKFIILSISTLCILSISYMTQTNHYDLAMATCINSRHQVDGVKEQACGESLDKYGLEFDCTDKVTDNCQVYDINEFSN